MDFFPENPIHEGSKEYVLNKIVCILLYCNLRLVVAQGHKRVIVNETVSAFDSHSMKLNISYFYFGYQAKARSSASQHAMPSEFSGGWHTEIS